jgi:hypothetical protein
MRTPGLVGTVAAYGPDASLATKLVASVIPQDSDADPVAMKTWTSTDSDLRNDRGVIAETMAFFAMHGATTIVRPDRIIGCPHEEGIDYPMGRVCPRCPFWAGIDRFTHERIPPPAATLSADDVLEHLSRLSTAPPVEALISADAHRAILVDRLLEVLQAGIAAPLDASEEQANLFCYALYLLAKWREPRAYPLVVAWLTLPDDRASAIAGDVVTQDGHRILAAVCDGDLSSIQVLMMNRGADEYSRAAAVEALGLLVAWGETPRDRVISFFATQLDDGLERVPSVVWCCLAAISAGIAAFELFPAIRRAYAEGLVDPQFMHPSELDAAQRRSPEDLLRETRERYPPIDDVASATSWWGRFGRDESVVLPSPARVPKIGRNDPCPCGSGKKYKKCCGR